MNLIECLRNDDTLTSIITILFLDKYGSAPLVDEDGQPRLWDTDTILLELEEDFPGIKISNTVLNRIYAGLILTGTADFLNDESVFNVLCQVMSNDSPYFDPGVVDFPEVEECAWAVLENSLMNGDSPDTASLSVKEFVSMLCKESGLVGAPGFLTEITIPWKSSAEILSDPNIYREQLEKQLRIDDFVRDRIKILTSQLSKLTVHRDKATAMAERIETTLKRREDANKPSAGDNP